MSALALQTSARLIKVAGLLFLLLAFHAFSPSAEVGPCYEKFSALFQQIKDTATRLYGPYLQLDRFKPEIADELAWVESSARQFSEDKRNLEARRSALNRDTSDLEGKKSWLSTRQRTLDVKKRDLDERLRKWTAEGEAHNRRFAEHESNPCFYPEGHPEQCVTYDAEKGELNAEAIILSGRRRALEREQNELDEQQSELDSEAGGLQSLSNVLGQTEETLNGEESQFVQTCEEATVRARALLEVLKNKDALMKPDGSTPPPDYKIVEKMMEGLGAQAAKHLFEALKTPIYKDIAKLVGAEYAGPILALLDAIEADMDDRATEIAKNTYLLGDYAAALKRLKARGELRPGDEGYDALLQMTSQLGNDMPGSEGEFLWQSVTTTKTAFKNAMEALATQYEPINSEHLAKGILKEVTPEDRKVIGKKGLAFFGKAMESVIGEAGTHLINEPVFKMTTDAISQQSQRATEQGLKRGRSK